MGKKIISFRLGELEEIFNEKCLKEGLTQTELIKMSLRHYLDKKVVLDDLDFQKTNLEKQKKVKTIKIFLTEFDLKILDSLKKNSVKESYQAVVIKLIRGVYLKGDLK